MENKLVKILIILTVILILSVIVMGLFFYSQSKKIQKITDIVLPSDNLEGAKAVPAVGSGSSATESYLQDTKDNLSEKTRVISGNVVSVDEKSLTVEAEIVDLENLKISDLEKDKSPMTKKTYSVAINNKTEFAGNKLPAIKKGDTIQILSKELVYQATNLTADKITCPYLPKK